MCQSSNSNKLAAARNENSILSKLHDCIFVNQKIAYFEDLTIDKVYLVLEKAGDEDLMQFVTQHQESCSMLKYDEVEQLTRQLLFAVEEIHKRGIAHRDLRPENVMVTSATSGSSKLQLRLIDFNVAHDFQNEK